MVGIYDRNGVVVAQKEPPVSPYQRECLVSAHTGAWWWRCDGSDLGVWRYLIGMTANGDIIYHDLVKPEEQTLGRANVSDWFDEGFMPDTPFIDG